MPYEIEIDKEITIGDKVYCVILHADLEYSCEEDPKCTGVKIVKDEIATLDGNRLPAWHDGGSIEKVIVENYPELTEAVDKALWDEIQKHTEDNYRDIMRDLQDARDDYDL